MVNKSNVLTNREYLGVVLPFIVSSLTQPLIGAVDTAVVGQLSSPIYLAGVSIGVTIFNTIYWVFGFLSVSTTGQSAQSLGKQDKKVTSFIHPLMIALVVGLIIVLFRGKIWNISMKVLNPQQDVTNQARLYFEILIYIAPITLSNYVILGWLMGQSKVKTSVSIQVSGNLLNVILDIIFVSILKLKVEGVAIATLISQIIIFTFGFICVIKYRGFSIKYFLNKNIWNKSEILKELTTNSDLMIRSICLIIVTNIFMAISTSFGTVVLATNTILIQIEGITGYFFGGLSSGASIFSGKASGEKNTQLREEIIRKTNKWCLYFVVFLSVIYIVYGTKIITLFTNIDEVVNTLNVYYLWIIPIIISSSIAVSCAGIFVGMLNAKPIRNSMILSLIIFLISCYLLVDKLQNHGLWMCYSMYYLTRSVYININVKNIQ